MADTAALLKRGEEAFQKKNYDYARDLFLNVITLDPNHEKAHKNLFAVCFKKAQEQGAKSRITGMFGKGKTAVQLAATKDNAKKLELAIKHLCDDPNDAATRTQLAQALIEMGHIVGAGAEAEIALQCDGKNVAAAKILVASFTHQGKIEEAQKTLEKIASFAGEDRDIAKLQRDIAARQTMDKGFQEGGNYRDSIKNKDGAALLEQQSHTVHTDEQFDALMVQIQKEIESNPTDARLPKKIADMYAEKRKDYTTAREWYKKASAVAPHDTVLKDKVEDCNIKLYDVQIEKAQAASDAAKLTQLKVDRLKYVIQAYERRVADRPTDMILRFELAKSYFIAGPSFLDKAITEFQQSVKDPKRKMDSHIYLGKAFQKKKNFPMAETQYQKAEESGLVSQTMQIDIWYNRAICNAEAGKKEQAMSFANKIIEVDINFKDISALMDKWQNGT